MNVEPTILVLADGQPPEELARELERHHVFTEFTTPSELADVFDVVAPDLVLLFGRKHFDTTAAFLARLPENRRVRLAVLAARSELASFREVDRELVATVLSLDISTSALAARLATVALRLAQKIQERARSSAPPAVTVVQPSVPAPPRAPLVSKPSEAPRLSMRSEPTAAPKESEPRLSKPSEPTPAPKPSDASLLPKVSGPPRPRGPMLPGAQASEGGSAALVSTQSISAGPPRPVMGARKSSRRPPEPEPADDLSDRPTLVRDPLEQSVATELTFDDRPTIAGEAPLQVDPSELEFDSSPESARETAVPESGKFPVAGRNTEPRRVARKSPEPRVPGWSGAEPHAAEEPEGDQQDPEQQAGSVDGAAPVLGGALPREPVAGAPGRLAAAVSVDPTREVAQLRGVGQGALEGERAPAHPASDAGAAPRLDDGSLGALEGGAPSRDVAVQPSRGRRGAVVLLAAGCLAAAAGFAWHTQQGRGGAGSAKSAVVALPRKVDRGQGALASPGASAPASAGAAARALEPEVADAPSGPEALWRVPVEPAPTCKELIPPPPEVNAVTVAFGNRAWDRARAALVRGDRKAAHVALCDAVQNHPQSLAVEGLVEHYLALHAPDQAKPWLDAALALRPERPRTIELEAILESQQGHEEAARKAWQRSVGITESETATTVRLARMSAAEVDGLLRAGDFQRAEGVARRAATLDPKSAIAAAALASVWLATSQDALAARWVARAEELDPKSPEAAVVRGDWHARAGDVAGAKLAYERAIELEPSNKAAWQKLGGMSGTKPGAAPAPDASAAPSSDDSAEGTAPEGAAPEVAAPPAVAPPAPAAVNPYAD